MQYWSQAKLLQSRGETAKVMLAVQHGAAASEKRFPLSDLLNVPIQRVLKYPLLMKVGRCGFRLSTQLCTLTRSCSSVLNGHLSLPPMKCPTCRQSSTSWRLALSLPPLPATSIPLPTPQDLARYINSVKGDSEDMKQIEEVEQSFSEQLPTPLLQCGRYRLDGELRVKIPGDNSSSKK